MSLNDEMTVNHVDEWDISRDRLQIGQKIGEGQFGVVLEGILMTGESGDVLPMI